jgi:NADH-quinone oxidoreductase subunit I
MKTEFPPAFNRKDCMACKICVDACPVSCIETEQTGRTKDPHGYPFLADESACIRCGTCADACPVDAVALSSDAA